MSEKRYFEKPTQIYFWDPDGNHWMTGIAYKDEVICACCGGIIEVAEIYQYAPKEVINPIIVLKWVDITDELVGGGSWPEDPIKVPDGPNERLEKFLGDIE